MNKRTHVRLSEALVKEIDLVVGRKQRSLFLTQAAEKELVRRRQLKALDDLIPWKEEDHPELKHGAAEYVRQLRQETERRTRRVIAR